VVAVLGAWLIMALFTSKADKDISILTRLYQLSPDLGKSVSELMASETAQFIKWWVEREEQEDGITERDVTIIAQFAYWIRLIMDGLADKEAPSSQTLLHWEYYEEHYAANPALEFAHGTAEQGDIPFIRFGPRYGQGGDNHEALIRYAIGSLWAAVERAHFRRCEECHSPFPTLVKSKRWCSQRCGNRAGERRRYAARFAEYKEFKKGTTIQKGHNESTVTRL
jgi:hypothetical protein